jgi:hypothetical protein
MKFKKGDMVWVDNTRLVFSASGDDLEKVKEVGVVIRTERGLKTPVAYVHLASGDILWVALKDLRKVGEK